MKKYIITMKEVWDQMTIVDAESEEEAIRLVEKGEGQLLDDGFEYNRTMDSEYWNVEEVPEEKYE